MISLHRGHLSCAQVLQWGVDLQNGELDAMGLPLFRPLTTYSWEQSDGLIKIYVPLRGVQTDLLRCHRLCRPHLMLVCVAFNCMCTVYGLLSKLLFVAEGVSQPCIRKIRLTGACRVMCWLFAGCL